MRTRTKKTGFFKFSSIFVHYGQFFCFCKIIPGSFNNILRIHYCFASKISKLLYLPMPCIYRLSHIGLWTHHLSAIASTIYFIESSQDYFLYLNTRKHYVVICIVLRSLSDCAKLYALTCSTLYGLLPSGLLLGVTMERVYGWELSILVIGRTCCELDQHYASSAFNQLIRWCNENLDNA